MNRVSLVIEDNSDNEFHITLEFYYNGDMYSKRYYYSDIVQLNDAKIIGDNFCVGIRDEILNRRDERVAVVYFKRMLAILKSSANLLIRDWR